jgi:pyruvate/2-oxoglutarate dehydrogenase complex dihydrolipoamide dehydrogenase (E3) component
VWHFLFKASGVERVRGTGTFKNAYTITVDDRGEEVGLYQPKHPKP